MQRKSTLPKWRLPICNFYYGPTSLRKNWIKSYRYFPNFYITVYSTEAIHGLIQSSPTFPALWTIGGGEWGMVHASYWQVRMHAHSSISTSGMHMHMLLMQTEHECTWSLAAHASEDAHSCTCTLAGHFHGLVANSSQPTSAPRPTGWWPLA